jgi:hypothetical protein
MTDISSDRYQYAILINKTLSSLKDESIAWRNILIGGDNEKILYTNWLYISKSQDEVNNSVKEIALKSSEQTKIKNELIIFVSLNKLAIEEKKSLFIDYVNQVNKENISIFLNNKLENKITKSIGIIANNINKKLDLKYNFLIEERRYIIIYGVIIFVIVFLFSVGFFINLTNKMIIGPIENLSEALIKISDKT